MDSQLADSFLDEGRVLSALEKLALQDLLTRVVREHGE